MKLNLITIGTFLGTLIGLTLLVGAATMPTGQFQPAIHLDHSYCVSIGDDNCDGMIVEGESGWICVPKYGGPLLCNVITIRNRR